MTETTSVRHTISATVIPTLSIIIIFTKFAAARVIPQSTATLISFQITLNISENSISLSESPRIIVTEACPPALPPVSISIGIKLVSTTYVPSAFS